MSSVSAMTMKAAEPTPTSTRATWSWSYVRARPVPTVARLSRANPTARSRGRLRPVGQVADRRPRDGETQEQHRRQPPRLARRQLELLLDLRQHRGQQPAVGRVEDVHREEQREDAPRPPRDGTKGRLDCGLARGFRAGARPGSGIGGGYRSAIRVGLIHGVDLRSADRLRSWTILGRSDVARL